ncbi:MAG TPA: hypothetical protein VF531_04345 [Bacillota bacterium]
MMITWAGLFLMICAAEVIGWLSRKRLGSLRLPFKRCFYNLISYHLIGGVLTLILGSIALLYPWLDREFSYFCFISALIFLGEIFWIRQGLYEGGVVTADGSWAWSKIAAYRLDDHWLQLQLKHKPLASLARMEVELGEGDRSRFEPFLVRHLS